MLGLIVCWQSDVLSLSELPFILLFCSFDRSIEELQQQNQKLLVVVRELSEASEASEKSRAMDCEDNQRFITLCSLYTISFLAFIFDCWLLYMKHFLVLLKLLYTKISNLCY